MADPYRPAPSAQYHLSGQWNSVAVRFEVPGRPDIQVTEYNRRAYDRLLEGDSVTVRYLPDRPEICRLEL